MAVIKLGGLISDIRGKLGQDVYSRGPGGSTIRSVGTWVQPDTAAQLECRATLEALSQAWSQVLTSNRRKAWKAYAATNPRPNRWGTLSQASGYLAFVRHNAHAYRWTSTVTFHDPPQSPPIHPPTLAVTVQQDGAIVATGTLSPDATGTYQCDGEYDGHPSWSCVTPSGLRYIWWSPTWWLNTETKGLEDGPRWASFDLAPDTWFNMGGATGDLSAAWSYDGSLARITTPPINYPDPPEDLTLYLFTGKPINAGQSYYNGPWSFMATMEPPTPATLTSSWLRWTWPVHASSPPYAWPADGTGSARLYAVAQDGATGAMSTKRILTPTFGSLAPW